MEDNEIVKLYWGRDSAAITATTEKYGKYCSSIAANILGNREDAEECVNDTYLNAWNSIPPQRPVHLAAFLGKITRNLSFDRYRYNQAEKRGSGEISLVLDELAECVSGEENTEKEFDRREMISVINHFLGSLPKNKRDIFVRRYWYADSVTAIAADYRVSAGSVAMTLKGVREKLKKHLLERGFEI